MSYTSITTILESNIPPPNQLPNLNELETVDLLKTAIENLEDGIVICNSEGVPLLINKSTRDVFGEINPDIPPSQWPEHYGLYHSDKKTRMKVHEIPILRALNGENIKNVELVVISPDRLPQTFTVSGQPIYNTQGQKLGAIAIVHKITDQRKTEWERDFYQAFVQELKIQKTFREEFVTMLAHDLRTPLSAIKSYAELIIKLSEKSAAHRHLADRIVSSIDRMDTMIQDLLDTNLIQAGQHLPLTLEECDLESILHTICEELTTLYGDRFLVLMEEPIIGYWNIGGLRRMIENLCSNAIKYGDPQTPITISASFSCENQHVRIAVHNYGHPISPEDQNYLFRPFHRTQSAQLGNQKGWGIGLTLVRGMTESLGGSVSVESSTEKGTTFAIILPLDARGYSKYTLNQNQGITA